MNFSNRRPLNWRIDEDGHLRVTICALKEGVFEYGAEETPIVAATPELRGKTKIMEYIPASEMRKKEALQSLEGKDIIVGQHDWQTPDNYGEAKIVGSVAGAPYVKGDELLVDAIIKCPDAIKNITSDRTPEEEKYIEVSAGYDGDLVIDKGTHNGVPFDAKQTNFRFNHILLLPSGKGRCGKDVRIVNTKQMKGLRMDKYATLKVRIANVERTFRFSNEEDAREAERMVEEERKFNAESVAEALEEKTKLSAQVSELQAQLAEHDKTLKEAKAELERVMDENTQEILAGEIAEQTDDEEMIVNAEVEQLAEEGAIMNAKQAVEAKEMMLNAIRTDADGKKVRLAQRRMNAVRVAMSNQGCTIPETWDSTAYDAAFEVLCVRARQMNSKKPNEGQRTLNGTLAEGTGNANMDNRARMLNAMRVKKGGKNDGK